jgi:hypothetical protein
MMEGDFVWLTMVDFVVQANLQPWTATNVYNGSEFAFRLKAFRAIKMVGACNAQELGYQ